MHGETVETNKILNTAKRHSKRNFKSAHFRRAYRTYCNNIELVQPEQFKKIVSGKNGNVLDMETFKNRKDEEDKVNSFVGELVDKRRRITT